MAAEHLRINRCGPCVVWSDAVVHTLLKLIPGPWTPLFESVQAFLNRELAAPFGGTVIAALLLIFPTLSGYRNSADLSIKWTTDYAPVYLHLTAQASEGQVLKTEPAHFQLVLPLESVVSATYFDKDLYDRHFAPRSAVSLELQA